MEKEKNKHLTQKKSNENASATETTLSLQVRVHNFSVVKSKLWLTMHKFYDSPTKEQFDEKIIDKAIKKITGNEIKTLQMHFVFASYYYSSNPFRLRSIIPKAMNKYSLKSVMVTTFYMRREFLITNEKKEEYCLGNISSLQESINDDLESFFQDLENGHKPRDDVYLYYLPKLSGEEMQLAERKDPNFNETLWVPEKNVGEAEMRRSESSSKFVKGWCNRKTFIIKDLDYITEPPTKKIRE